MANQPTMKRKKNGFIKLSLSLLGNNGV